MRTVLSVVFLCVFGMGAVPVPRARTINVTVLNHYISEPAVEEDGQVFLPMRSVAVTGQRTWYL